MTELRQQNAIDQSIYLGGAVCERNPVPIQMTQLRFETKTRTSSLGIRIDRCFRGPGMPNIPNRREVTLPWPDVREPALLERLDRLTATGQPFTLGLWKQEYDVFDGDGVSDTFYLQRRQLLPVITPNPLREDFPTRITLYSGSWLDPASTSLELAVTQKLSADIDTGSVPSDQAYVESDGHLIGNVWVSKVRLGNIPPDASDCLIAAYLPLYTMVVDQEAERAYARPLQEGRGLKLVEFG